VAKNKKQKKTPDEQLRRAVPIAFRSALVPPVAKRTLDALKTRYELEGKPLARRLGISESTLTNWKENGDLSLPMLVHVLHSTELSLHFVPGDERVLKGEGARGEVHMCGLKSAIGTARGILHGPGANLDELTNATIGALVLLWKWGPENNQSDARWVWEPSAKWPAPAPEVDDSDDEDGEDVDAVDELTPEEVSASILEGRVEASRIIRAYAEEGGESRAVVGRWIREWGEAAFAALPIVRSFCIEPDQE